ncbi:membrane integrity-associated transporter subunit PqiC [Musicola keenii]|uniref:membrane integrity-associated transporter subunit PqiC n=1 Tax=Musicola keenii TaxID=2884250 RepID=UPI00177AE423|nr:membrane integrity-associated transporter subunit PqiC [Musicola keenii]
MMKRWSLLLLLLLGACSSPQKNYYQLPAVTSSSAVVSQTAGRQLLVAPVTLTDALAGNGIVFQTSDVRYTLTTQNQWASPLDQQLQLALLTTLRSGLPGWDVTTSGAGATPVTLQVNVTAFQGRFDGRAIVRGEWVLRDKSRVVTQPFNVEVSLREDGYDALVKALAQGWQQVSLSLAHQVAASS